MPSIEEAAEELSSREGKRQDLAEKFRNVEEIERDHTAREGFLKKKISGKEQPEQATGIDGGLIRKRYSSGDIVGVRAVAASFDFTGSLEVEYLPSKSPEPEFHVFNADDSDSLQRNAEAERLRAETNVILESLDESNMVLVDGSVVPSYLESEEVLENYNQIFDAAESGKLVGVVEDSYGLKMAGLLEEKLNLDLGKIRDTLLMDAVLEEGERSFVRRYSDSPAEHPVLKKLKDRYVTELHTFYVKLSSKDLPLRIDFYGKPEDADEIARQLLSLKSSERYTVPSPIVEADKRAKIPEKYLKRLEKRFSPEVRRRDRRLFG